MSIQKKPLAIVLGAAFALGGGVAQASVFQAADLNGGYMQLAEHHEKTGEHKCGEGKCGEKKKDGKAGEHKCGEGKCGEKKG